jgi:hypothetical protein
MKRTKWVAAEGPHSCAAPTTGITAVPLGPVFHQVRLSPGVICPECLRHSRRCVVVLWTRTLTSFPERDVESDIMWRCATSVPECSAGMHAAATQAGLRASLLVCLV